MDLMEIKIFLLELKKNSKKFFQIFEKEKRNGNLIKNI
jgi:hypothetical protein